MMRRMLAVVLLIAFGLPLATPLVAASTDPDSNLPACCRRHGIHHCNMAMGAPSSTAPTFQTPPCPVYPNVATQVRITGVALAVQAQSAGVVPNSASPSHAHDSVPPIIGRTTCLTRGPPIQLI